MNSTTTNAELIIYTVEDVMRILRISRNQAYKLFNSDGFPSFRIGSSHRITKSAFEKWVYSTEGRKFLI